MRGSDLASYFRQQAVHSSRSSTSTRLSSATSSSVTSSSRSQLLSAQQELAAVDLPALTDPTSSGSRLTGFQGFARRDPALAIEQERKVTDARRSRRSKPTIDLFSATCSSARRARSSRSSTKRARRSTPLQAAAQFESLRGFTELVEIGYDTPQFDEKWWHASYWKHWATGDRICKHST